jgi:hypothetical protein
MKKRTICLVISIAYLCCIAVSAQQQAQTSDSGKRFHKRLSKAEKEHILDGLFTSVATTGSMPQNAKQAFRTITDEPSFALADPGQKYQDTDVITEQDLPSRRLVFAGVKGDEWFVHYERGGYVHSYLIVVFKLKAQDQFQFLWGGAGFQGAKDVQELRKMIAAGQFSDDHDYYW